MREGWEIKKLGDLTTALNGLWVGKKPPFVNIAVIRNTNFTKDCQLDTTDIAYIDAEVKHFSTRKLQCGDIIIEKSGGSDKQPVGRPVLFSIPEGDFSFSNFTSTLRINDQSEMLPSFLHKALWAIYRSGKTASLQSKTTGIRNLDFKSYLKLPIPVPPIAEQENIVAELDSLTGIIEKKKQQLEELDKLAQSIFYDMFGDPISNEKGWEQRTMKELFVFSQGIQVPVEEQSANKLSGYVRFLRIIDFTQQGEPPRFIKNPGDKYFLKNGEIAIVRYGSPGFVCYGVDEGAIANNLFKVTPKSSSYFHHRFLSFLLKTDVFQRPIKGEQYGATMKAISFKTIGGIVLPIPPRDLQNAFAIIIEAIEKQKELVKRSIVETETLFNSRMDYWFN